MWGAEVSSNYSQAGNFGRSCSLRCRFLGQICRKFYQLRTFGAPSSSPDYIVSPQTTLEWQTGDCFDLSILLASLLIGAGYNAYVCIGYADKMLTEQQTHLQVAESCEPLNLYATYTVQSFSSEAAFSKRPLGIYKVDARYCREVNDTHIDKQDFTSEGGLLKRLHSPRKTSKMYSLGAVFRSVKMSGQQSLLISVEGPLSRTPGVYPVHTSYSQHLRT